jgi:2-dehydropantoate 2-reductase
LDVRPRLEEKVDLAILTVKTQDIRDAVDKSNEFLREATILTTQNGVRADKLLGMMIGEAPIISSIVMFGATYVPYNKIVHNFEGDWLIGRPFRRPNDEKVKAVVDFLKVAFSAVEVSDIGSMKWTKIFINFSNCLPALVGRSMQETYAELSMCRWALRLLKEGFEVVEKMGIKLSDMPEFQVDKLRGLTLAPLEQAAPIFSGIMTQLSKEPLYGSILQSIQRGRPSEIDFINGEIANQGKLNNLSVKLNTRVTELVHHVERTKKFLAFQQVDQEMEKADQIRREDFI